MFGDLDLRVPRRISWARIFPFGTADSPVNQEAIKHYSDRKYRSGDMRCNSTDPYFSD
jgi:hypothetical protein